MARTARKRTRPNTYNGDQVEVLSISSDSSDEVVVEIQGTQDVAGEVVVASEVVEARPVKTGDEEEDTSSEESMCEDLKPHVHQWCVTERVADGEATVQLLEQDLLDGLCGAQKHKKDPFRRLRFAYGETDWEYCYGYNQDLDNRIDRLKSLVEIPQRYEEVGKVVLYKNLNGRARKK